MPRNFDERTVRIRIKSYDELEVLKRIVSVPIDGDSFVRWESIASDWMHLDTSEGSCRRAFVAADALLRAGLISGETTWLGLHRFGALVTREELNAMTRVFVVHGHDDLKETVARFIDRIGLEAVILSERASSGAGILEKIERYGDVGFAVVLLTPDDIGAKATEPSKLRPRARQNVVLELGYFIGRLGRARVHCLYKGDIELPSDYHGIVYTSVDAPGAEWRLELVRELEAVGIPVDRSRLT